MTDDKGDDLLKYVARDLDRLRVDVDKRLDALSAQISNLQYVPMVLFIEVRRSWEERMHELERRQDEADVRMEKADGWKSKLAFVLIAGIAIPLLLSYLTKKAATP